MTTYLLHSSILLSAISIFYWVALRHETFFRLNRWTIMLSIFLSLSLPLIHVPAEYVSWRTNDAPVTNIVEKLVSPTVIEKGPVMNTEAAQEPAKGNNENIPVASKVAQSETNSPFQWASIGKILVILYFIGVAIFSIVFLMQLFVLIVSRSNLNSFKTGKYNIVEMVKDKEPFSFMKSIYINPSNYDEDTYNHIIEHEKIHIDQSHFLDKIIAEILVILFWFNPLTWLLRNGISRNLEFLTDQSLLNNGIQKSSYQMSLLKVSVSNQPFNLTMSYNSSFLKNRIDMMNTKKSSIVSSWKYLFIPPLFLLSIFSLNALDGEIDPKKDADKKADKTELTQKEKVWKKAEVPVQRKQKNLDYQNANDQTEAKTISLSEKSKDKKSSADSKSKSKSLDKYSAVASRTLDIAEFSKLGLAINGDVELTSGNTQKVRVEGPENLIDELDTEVKNGSWNIRFRDHKNWKKYKNAQKLKFYITMTELENVAISGNGNVVTTNKFDVDRLMLAISGNGNLEINTDANSIFYAISGNGNGDLQGKTDELKITSSGNGEVDASGLKSNTCHITISGSGDVKVDVKDTIKATISGSANVYYKGSPTITKKVSGSGKFRQM